ncbi:MAG: hypothetical protein GEV08_01145 [Acidimicrobiia bacterium]|nr:hypothetical protein [Acidimicrobiia bacterium]
MRRGLQASIGRPLPSRLVIEGSCPGHDAPRRRGGGRRALGGGGRRRQGGPAAPGVVTTVYIATLGVGSGNETPNTADCWTHLCRDLPAGVHRSAHPRRDRPVRPRHAAGVRRRGRRRAAAGPLRRGRRGRPLPPPRCRRLRRQPAARLRRRPRRPSWADPASPTGRPSTCPISSPRARPDDELGDPPSDQPLGEAPATWPGPRWWQAVPRAARCYGRRA